jgi:hypothetical protein
VPYFTIRHGSEPGIDWDWLDSRKATTETRFLRHLELDRPPRVKVDGRSGRGGIWVD